MQKSNSFFSSFNTEGESIWGLRDEDLPPVKRFVLRLKKICFIAWRDPFNQQILNHASALSYKFILSLIPMLAMIFSIAKGFGIQDKIEPLLLEKTLGGEIASDLIPKIIQYVNNTNVAALGSIGLVFILYTAISMLSQIESSFNQIWTVTQPRTLVRKISDYLAILTISPLLLAVTIGLPTTLQSHIITQKLLEIGLLAGAMKLFLFSLPWLTSILSITLLYIVIPNTRVHFLSALIAGIFSGCCWQFSQIFFIKFQVGVAKYNAIYGTFASVPIFMIWLYVSWVIVLFGGVVNYACQNHKKFHPMKFKEQVPFASLEKIALAALIAIFKNFDKEQGGLTCEEISDRLGINRSLVKKAVSRLLEIGAILSVDKEKNECYVPAKPSDKVKLTDYFQDIKGKEKNPVQFKDPQINNAVCNILSTHEKSLHEGFKDRGINSVL